MITLVKVDPYHPVTGLLVPFLCRRIMDMAASRQEERDPQQFTRDIMSRLWAQDPSLGVLAMLDEKGRLVGHAVATIETDGKNHWLFVQQTKADGDVGDAVDRAMGEAKGWAAQVSERLVTAGFRPITKGLMVTTRSDAAWQRRHKLKAIRHVMEFELTEEREGV